MTVTPDQHDDMDCRPLTDAPVQSPYLAALIADHAAAKREGAPTKEDPR